MCLITFTNIPTVAEEDITTYKLVKCGIKKNVFYPPLFDNYKDCYRIGKMERPNRNINNLFRKIEICKEPEPNTYSVHGGVIHSSSSVFYAMNVLLLCKGNTYAIIKCTIPKGAKYFANENRTSFASNKLRFDEVLIDFSPYKFSCYGKDKGDVDTSVFEFENENGTMAKALYLNNDSHFVIIEKTK